MTVFHNILIDKLLKYALDKWTVMRAENWLGLEDCGQQHEVPAGGQALIVYPRGQYCVLYRLTSLFMIWVMEQFHSVSLLAANVKLRGVAHLPEGCTAVQGHVSRLEKRADRNIVKFSKCKMPGSAPELNNF